MMILNWGARFRWVPEKIWQRDEETWFLDIRWLRFQWTLYSADMAEAAIDNFNAFAAQRLGEKK